MHELSVAESIIDIIHQYVAPERLTDVRAVSVRLGTFSGVVWDSLEFSFQALTSGTPLERSRLTAEHVPFTVHCRDCDATSVREDGAVLCSVCGSANTDAVSGTELEMKDIELEDTPTERQQ